MKYYKVQIHEFSLFNNYIIILSQFLTIPEKLKPEASMYQGNGSNDIAKNRVRNQSFYFIVRLFFKLPAYPFVNYFMF